MIINRAWNIKTFLKSQKNVVKENHKETCLYVLVYTVHMDVCVCIVSISFIQSYHIMNPIKVLESGLIFFYNP